MTVSNKILKKIIKLPSRLIILLIKIYQKSLSPDHGILKIYHPHGFCRFAPSCSSYAIDAIGKYGVIGGGAKAIWRLIRCNPFNPGGFDPVK